MNRNSSLIIIVAAAAAIGGLAGAWLLAPAAPPELAAGTLLTEPRALPEFRMIRHDESTFTRADLEGQWSLVFFGFTHCPDVCPNTLFLLDRVTDALKQQNVTAPDVVFVSVDTERDTPEQLAGYVRYFNPEFIGVTGDDDNLQKLAQAMSVAYEFKPAEEGSSDEYTVIHSSAVLLIDPGARLHALFTPPLHADAITGDLLQLVSD